MMKPPQQCSRKEVAEERFRKQTSRRGTGANVSYQPKKRQLNLKVGDVSRRVTIALPNSLEALKRRARELFPEYSTGHHFDLYLEKPRHSIHQPKQKQVKIISEVAYHTISDDDLVILVMTPITGWASKPQSTMQADFPPQPYAKASILRPPAADTKGKSRFFEMQTTYDHDFVAPPLQPSKLPCVSGAPPRRSFFDGRTTYQDTYVHHKSQGAQPTAKPVAKWAASQNTFVHRSSYEMDYPRHVNAAPAKNCFTHRAFKASKGSQEMWTTYQADFPVHKVEARSQGGRPKTADVTSLPFDGESTYNRDYTTKKNQGWPQIHVEPAKDAAPRPKTAASKF